MYGYKFMTYSPSLQQNLLPDAWYKTHKKTKL
jgi:hypothetical protein